VLPFLVGCGGSVGWDPGVEKGLDEVDRHAFDATPASERRLRQNVWTLLGLYAGLYCNLRARSVRERTPSLE
jgi:hypothetical protein